MMVPNDYDPATCITAGELREAGFKVPDDVPGCGWIPRTAIMPVRVGAVTRETGGRLHVPIEVLFTSPFRWIEVEIEQAVDDVPAPAKARLDPRGTEKPKTEIVGVYPAGAKNFYSNALGLIHRETEHPWCEWRPACPKCWDRELREHVAKAVEALPNGTASERLGFIMKACKGSLNPHGLLEALKKYGRPT